MHWEVYKGSSTRLLGKPRVRFSRSELVWRGAQCTEKSVSQFYCLLNDLHLKIFKMKVLVVQSCVTLWDPMDCSSLGSSVHGILQAKILEWVVISSFGDLPDRELEPASLCLLNWQEVLHH